MLLSRLLFIAILWIPISGISQQQIGFVFQNPRARRVEIPFERYNNLVVLPVQLNNTITLNFILDSGVQNAILTEKVYGDILGLNYDRNVTIRGPGENDSIRVFVVDNVDLSLPGIPGKNLPLLVLDQDFMKLSNNLGHDVHGIIGYDLFKQFVVEIDFDERKAIFHDKKRFHARRYYDKIPISVEGTKPYADVQITQANGQKIDVKLLVDTGASHAILINPATDADLEIPEKNITAVLGTGLGGEIAGLVGRLNNMKIGRFTFYDLISVYPNEDDYGYGLRSGDRNGTLGGELLSHFNYILNYDEAYLYLRRSQEYRKKSEFDLCGLDLLGKGIKYATIVVNRVRENSPAARAGVKKGDIILSINGMTSTRADLNDINGIIRSRHGRTIILKIKRNEEELKVKFKLERLI